MSAAERFARRLNGIARGGVTAVRSSERPRRSEVVWRGLVVALTLIAFVLRAYDLAGQCLWSDEDIALDRSQLPLGQLLGSLPVEHAPLYFVLLRAWTALAGHGDLALRFPSALAGTLAVPLGVQVASRLAGRWAGATVGLLLASQPFAVSYGQEARMYALLLALSLAAPLAILRAERASADRAQRRPSAPPRGADAGPSSARPASRGARAWWLVAGLLAAIATYTHYYGALVGLILAAWGAFAIGMAPSSERARVAGGWLLAGAAAVAAFAPWLPRAALLIGFPGWRDMTRAEALVGIAGAWTGGTAVNAAPFASWTDQTAVGSGWISAHLPWLLPSIALIGVAHAVRCAARGTSRHRRSALRLLSWIAIPSALVAVLLWHDPDVHPRYLMPLHAGIYLAAGTGIGALAGGRPPRSTPVRSTIAGIVLAGLAVSAIGPLRAHYTDPAARKPDYRALLAAVEARSSGGDTRLLLDGPSLGLAKRYRTEDSELKLENLRSEENLMLSPDELDRRLADLAGRRPYLWLAADGSASHAADAWLSEHLFPMSNMSVGHVTLERYFSPPASLLDDLSTAAHRAHACSGQALCAELTAAAYRPDGPGGAVALRIAWLPGDDWESSPPARAHHRVSVRLLDAEGAVIARSDRRPGDWTHPTTTWEAGGAVIDLHALAAPSDPRSGDLWPAAVLYDEATLEPYLELRLTDPVGVGSILRSVAPW